MTTLTFIYRIMTETHRKVISVEPMLVQTVSSLSFPRKSMGKNAKQVSVGFSHVRTLTCVTFFPTDFLGKERLLAIYTNMGSTLITFLCVSVIILLNFVFP